MILIGERHENDYSYKIYRDTWEKEYTVKYYFKGLNIQWMDYFTDNEKDARVEAKKQINRFLVEDMKKGA